MDVIFILISLSSILSFVLGLLVFRNNPSSSLNRWYSIFSYITGLWIFSNILLVFFPYRFWINLVYSLGALVPASAIMWILYFCGRTPSANFKKYLLFFAIFFFFIPYLSGNLFLKNIKEIYLGSVKSQYGIFFIIYILYQFSLFSFILFEFVRYYIISKDKLAKRQTKFIFLGALLWILVVSITSFILPILGVSKFMSLDSASTSIFLIFTAYAITKHHLFNIKVITTELFTFTLWVILLTKIFLSRNLQELGINVILFFSVLAFGILLIRSVIKEVKQREDIEKLAKDIERAYQIEKQARQELENLDKAKNQFLLATQHHLRTPLTSIIGFSDLLIEDAFGKLPKKAKGIIKKIEQLAESLVKMINEFLDITQFQLGKEVVTLESNVSIEDLLKTIFNELKFQAEKKGLSFKLEISEPLPLVKADLEKLKAALYNVIDNAIKYNPEGSVNITASRLENSVLITVKDTGIGMNEQTMDKLFKTTFERGEEAKKQYHLGKGIGLYLSSEIIKAHKGKLWAESEGEGKGSTFFVELPISNS